MPSEGKGTVVASRTSKQHNRVQRRVQPMGTSNHAYADTPSTGNHACHITWQKPAKTSVCWCCYPSEWPQWTEERKGSHLLFICPYSHGQVCLPYIRPWCTKFPHSHIYMFLSSWNTSFVVLINAYLGDSTYLKMCCIFLHVHFPSFHPYLMLADTSSKCFPVKTKPDPNTSKLACAACGANQISILAVRKLICMQQSRHADHKYVTNRTYHSSTQPCPGSKLNG